MNDQQARRFRIRVSGLIDDILSTTNETLSTSSTPSSLQSQPTLPLPSVNSTEQMLINNWYDEDSQY